MAIDAKFDSEDVKQAAIARMRSVHDALGEISVRDLVGAKGREAARAQLAIIIQHAERAIAFLLELDAREEAERAAREAQKKAAQPS